MKNNLASPVTSGRRNFIFAAMMTPFIFYTLKVNSKSGEAWLRNPLKDDNFIIIDGWVLLKEDFNNNKGGSL